MNWKNNPYIFQYIYLSFSIPGFPVSMIVTSSLDDGPSKDKFSAFLHSWVVSPLSNSFLVLFFLPFLSIRSASSNLRRCLQLRQVILPASKKSPPEPHWEHMLDHLSNESHSGIREIKFLSELSPKTKKTASFAAEIIQSLSPSVRKEFVSNRMF